MSMVRLAFVTSVTCTPPSGPPVRFQISQVSIVPNSTSPRSARSRSRGSWSSIQVSRGPAKYGASGSPHRSRKRSGPCSPASSCTRSAVRVSCQTSARATGRPVARSHTTVVSRWLAMPIATTCSGAAPARCTASGTTRRTLRQISAASCSTQPGRG